MSNKLIIIITCGSTKALTKSRAEKMYVGGHFKNCLKWAKSSTITENIFILSAKYGLLKLDEMIAPYDLKMGQKGSVTGEFISRQAHDLGFWPAKGFEIISSAGEAYQGPLIKAFGQSIKFPFKGLSMGYMAQAMKRIRSC